jgi:hypothetical protein
MFEEVGTYPNTNFQDKIAAMRTSYEEASDLPNGVKYDDDKIQMELLPLRELREVAKVLTYGAKKYAPDNWKQVPDAKERYAGALLRHFTEYREGNHFDDEARPDKLRHIAQTVCNALFLLYFELQDEVTVANNPSTPVSFNLSRVRYRALPRGIVHVRM